MPQLPQLPQLSRLPQLPQLPQFVRWRQRAGGQGSAGLGDMELGRRGVVFDNRIVFDISATSFDNLTFGNQPRVGLHHHHHQRISGSRPEQASREPQRGPGKHSRGASLEKKFLNC